MRYSPTGPLVLRGIDIEVRPGTRVSVVGRTGAGKSSLLVSLLRLVEPCGGSVIIDGIDVASLPLRLLRRRVCVISQVSARGNEGQGRVRATGTSPGTERVTRPHRHPTSGTGRTPSSSPTRSAAISTRSETTLTRTYCVCWSRCDC